MSTNEIILVVLLLGSLWTFAVTQLSDRDRRVVGWHAVAIFAAIIAGGFVGGLVDSFAAVADLAQPIGIAVFAIVWFLVVRKNRREFNDRPPTP